MNKTKKILCSIGIILITLIMLIPFFYTVVLSTTAYSPFKGLFASPSVGLENFIHFFRSPYFTRLLSNSLAINILGTIVGAVYVLVSSLGIGNAKNPIVKGLLTAVFAIPAIIPVNFFTEILPYNFLLRPSFLLRFAVSAIDGLRTAGLVAVAAFFIKKDVLKESLKCVLLFISIKLIFIFSNDLSLIVSVYQPVNFEVLDVFTSYSYRTGYTANNYSLSATAHVIKTALQFIPAIIACVILVLSSKRRNDNHLSSDNKFHAVSISAILPIALLIAVLITSFSQLPKSALDKLMSGYMNEFLIAFLSALCVTIISVILAVMAKNASTVGYIALVLLGVTGSNFMGKFFIISSTELFSSYSGIIFYNLSMVSVLTLILTYATHNSRGIFNTISMFIIGFALMFGRFWGDFFAPMIIRLNRAQIPLSTYLRELLPHIGGIMFYSPPYPDEYYSNILLSTLPHILIPVIAVCIGFIISAKIKSSSEE